MMRKSVVIICFLLSCYVGMSNNVRITKFSWIKGSVTIDNQLDMNLTLEWENSWRDAYNYDAVYVFFKYKMKEAPNTITPKETWHHLYLLDAGNVVAPANQYACWTSPLSAVGINQNTGVYVYRNQNGAYAKNSVNLTVRWALDQQLVKRINRTHIEKDSVVISADAIEMVYVPRGAFGVGDGASSKSFRRTYSPIWPRYDLVDTSYVITASSGYPKDAADRLNDNTAWTGGAKAWWRIDFGEPKRIAYFGVNGLVSNPTYIPVTFRLRGEETADGTNWKTLWEGPGAGNWNVTGDAYPVQKAIKIDEKNRGNYRRYEILIESMAAGNPIVTSVAMSDSDLSQLNDYSVLIDGTVTEKDTLKSLGAPDGMDWKGTLPTEYPNGFRGFYAMKYELSQEQMVKFLNKLTYTQQNNLLNGRLAELSEGEYVFGDPQKISYRNGIVLATKIKGMPAVFTNNYTSGDAASQNNDGQNIACNYVSQAIMMAYADWTALRPLSEMEFEKMARPLCPMVPVKRGYAWNTRQLYLGNTLVDAGTPTERLTSGNANYSNWNDGPVRVGAFAGNTTDRVLAGASYWGCMEMSGNLAEMYYNANYAGLKLIWPEIKSGAEHRTAHGDGELGIDGFYNGAGAATVGQWSKDPNHIALRGGSFMSDSLVLAISDRSCFTGFVASYQNQDSTVTFRLGRSLPDPVPLVSKLVMENGISTEGNKIAKDTTVCDRHRFYAIRGNCPDNVSGFCSYIWKMRRTTSEKWVLLEDEHDKDLIFTNFNHNTTANQIYQFMRTVYTPFNDSSVSSVFYVELLIRGK